LLGRLSVDPHPGPLTAADARGYEGVYDTAGSANAFPSGSGTYVADTVRVGLDGFVLDALGSQALQERVETGDGEGDPACARPRSVGLDEQRGVLVDVPEDFYPGAHVRGRPKNRVYQSIAAPSSDTGTPAMR
jgi:hypothetical protein